MYMLYNDLTLMMVAGHMMIITFTNMIGHTIMVRANLEAYDRTLTNDCDDFACFIYFISGHDLRNSGHVGHDLRDGGHVGHDLCDGGHVGHDLRDGGHVGALELDC
jgi:hypothetical protein